MKITIFGEHSTKINTLGELLRDATDWSVSSRQTGGLEELADETVRMEVERSDVSVLDLADTSMPCTYIIRTFRGEYPEAVVIGMHYYKNEKLVRTLINLGLDGYIPQEPARNLLIEAIKTVSRGERYVVF